MFDYSCDDCGYTHTDVVTDGTIGDYNGAFVLDDGLTIDSPVYVVVCDDGTSFRTTVLQ